MNRLFHILDMPFHRFFFFFFLSEWLHFLKHTYTYLKSRSLILQVVWINDIYRGWTVKDVSWCQLVVTVNEISVLYTSRNSRSDL